ncbi:unnamed protein product [Cladocopium goreaui]|uniref:Acetylcholine receptor subunit alpha-like 1 n=1 Tax=Cladocopium goreaui TaxID=2562237 RepID=A0A9P1GH24_9DINO|nr:unnamed protein product [Cladocopium goreaui]
MSDSSHVVGTNCNGTFEEVLLRLHSLEKRVDRIDGNVQGSPNFVEPTIKLEEKMLQFELQLGQFSGVVSGVKEALLSQTGQCSRIEEKWSSQLQALQANLQTCELRFTTVSQQVESLSKMVSKVTKEQLKVHDSSNDPSVESLQEMLVKMSSRVSNLESSARDNRAGTAAGVASEVVPLRPQIVELQATTQRLRTEILAALSKLEEQAVHVSSCRIRLDALEADVVLVSTADAADADADDDATNGHAATDGCNVATDACRHASASASVFRTNAAKWAEQWFECERP